MSQNSISPGAPDPASRITYGLYADSAEPHAASQPRNANPHMSPDLVGGAPQRANRLYSAESTGIRHFPNADPMTDVRHQKQALLARRVASIARGVGRSNIFKPTNMSGV